MINYFYQNYLITTSVRYDKEIMGFENMENNKKKNKHGGFQKNEKGTTLSLHYQYLKARILQL